MLHWLYLFCWADVNECSNQDICGFGGQCFNLLGSYRCECHSGFRSKSHRHAVCEGTDTLVAVTLWTSPQRLSFICKILFPDINECLNPDTCPNEQCENTLGSYECVPCLPGHEARAGTCYGENNPANCLFVCVDFFLWLDNSTEAQHKPDILISAQDHSPSLFNMLLYHFSCINCALEY